MSKYDDYAEIIVDKYERGLINEGRFISLLGKISEWERMNESYGGKDK